MSDFDWDDMLDIERATEVHRRLGIDDRDYHVVVFDAGGGFVGLRVTGWEAEGMLVDVAGQLPAVDAPEVGALLATVLTGYRGDRSRPPDPPPIAPLRDWWTAYRSAAPNAGRPWAPEDLELLIARFNDGASVKSLSVELGRTEGGIRSRLQLLGLSRAEPDEAAAETGAGPAAPGVPGDGSPPGGGPAAPATPGAEGSMPMAG